MSSPFQKKFCGKTPGPIKMLGDLNKDGVMSSYEQTRQDAIEANTPSPVNQIDPKLAVKMAEKTKQADRYKKYVESKKRGLLENNSSDYMSSQKTEPKNSNTMDFNRFVVGEEIAKGGKRGSEAFKHHLNVSKAIKAGKTIANSPLRQEKKVKLENWSENPIPETEKKQHPDFNRAMKNIKAYNEKIGTKGATKFFRDSLENKVIKHKGKNYPLIALVTD